MRVKADEWHFKKQIALPFAGKFRRTQKPQQKPNKEIES